MACLIDLCIEILSRHEIPARNIVGHSDVAPRRKEDPGELFDWSLLASNGIGRLPDKSTPALIDKDECGCLLQSIGYDISDLSATLTAFQRRYRPTLITSDLDVETGGLIKSVADLN
jgi:N-acetylmuramoyl-L-alanine amidase